MQNNFFFVIVKGTFLIIYFKRKIIKFSHLNFFFLGFTLVKNSCLYLPFCQQKASILQRILSQNLHLVKRRDLWRTPKIEKKFKNQSHNFFFFF